MNIEPWVFWFNISTSFVLIGYLFKQMAEINKVKQLADKERAKKENWEDACNHYMQSEHDTRLSLIRTEQARDSVLRLNAKQVKELQNYKAVLQEIADTPEGMTINRFAPYSLNIMEPAQLYTPREFAQEALKGGGKVSWNSRS